MNKYIVVAECAIMHSNKFLIIKRPKGKHAADLLSLPGGKFEIKDGKLSPEQDVLINTVRREIFEELGLNLTDPINYVTTSFFKDERTNELIIDIIFYCRLNNTKIDINASEREVPEYYWLTYQEIKKKNNCPEWLLKYLNKILTE